MTTPTGLDADAAIDRELTFIGPDVDDTNEFFFDSTAKGQLAFQRCTNCAAWWNLPAQACHACGGTDYEVVATSGRGFVHTYAIPRRPAAALLDEGLVFVVVELDEGVRIFSRLVDVEADVAAIDFGMRVKVAFARSKSGAMVPVFVPDQRAA